MKQDNKNKSGSHFLQEEIEKHINEHGYLYQDLPVKKNSNSHYSISDIEGNEKQEQVVFTVLKKLKEWVEYPEAHKRDKTTTFKPLHMTIMGVGGTGKSFLVSVLVTIIKQIFYDENEELVTTLINAPTGAAAFNANGKTCHNTWKIPIKKPFDLSEEKKHQMREELKRILFLCVDERSMLSKAIFGAINSNAQHTVHNNLSQSTKPFGGIPIVIITGDDHQLPSVTIGEDGQGITYFFKKRTSNIKRSKEIQRIEKIGEDAFIQCAQNVIELETIKRLEDDAHDLKKILEDLRCDGISNDDAKKLLQLHIRHLPAEKRNQIEEDAVYLFATKQLKSEHNMKKLKEITNENNPVCLLQTKILHKKSEKWNGKRSHYDRDSIPSKSFLAKGAKVALAGKNFQPNWGLYNGALGTIIGFKFAPGKNPQTNDLPEYVVVDFPSYKGPPWIDDKPTYVPIPPVTVTCNRGCCEAYFIPLCLAFARTIHTFQGMEAGPSKAIKKLIVDVGNSNFEAINPGVLYTALSRASTLGNSEQDSAIYFSGPLTFDRLTNVRYKRSHNQKKIYEKVEMREKWISYLKERKQHTEVISFGERQQLKHWATTIRISAHQLDSIINYHKSNDWEKIKVIRPKKN